MRNLTCQQLEQAAIRAHSAGRSWADFWPTVAGDVAAAEPIDARRYHRLVRRLVGLVAAGDLDGMHSPGDGWPSEAADEPHPAAPYVSRPAENYQRQEGT